MSLILDGTGDYARATLSGLFSSNAKIFQSLWFQWDNTITSGYVLCLFNGAANPGMAIEINTTPAYRAQFNAANALTSGTPSDGTWTHLACSYGPWDNTSQSRRFYINGVLVSNGAVPLNFPGNDLTRLTIGGNFSNTPGALMSGKYAEVLVHEVADTTESDALAALCYTRQVTATALGFTPDWSRRLLNDYTTGHGTGDPSGAGDAAFDADHPSLLAAPPAAGGRTYGRVILPYA